CVDVERPGNSDEFIGARLWKVNFHAVAHVEHLVHFLPIRSTLFLDDFEQWQHIEKVVLDNVESFNKVEYFRLSAAAAMNHTVYVAAHLLQYLDDNRSVRARRREHKFPDVDLQPWNAVCNAIATRVHKRIGNVAIV